MKNSNKTNPVDSIIVRQTADEFLRGVKLLESLSDLVYGKKSYGVGTIGSHFRHNLDFANNLLKGFESNRIDYNTRERDLKIETNRRYAIERFLSLIQALEQISTDDFEREILVRSEVDDHIWHKSSVARELEFLHSHTVHHFALIAEKLYSFGINISEDFGVAPSTLKFWSEQQAQAKVA